MRRAAALAVLWLLSGCATPPANPCPPGTAASPCPVYKTPEEAALAPACTPCGATSSQPAFNAFPVPRGFQPWAEGFEGDMRFVVGDELRVTLPFYDDEDVTTSVAPDGKIYVGLIGGVAAAGRSPGDLERDLERRYAEYLRFPDVGIIPMNLSNRQIFVGGEVRNPGALPLRGPTGVLEAVFAAGGFEDTAYMRNVVLIRRGPNDLPMMRFLDLKTFANEGTPTENTLLQPFDIVFVPKSPIAKVNQFVEQYIEGVVPFNQNIQYTIDPSK